MTPIVTDGRLSLLWRTIFLLTLCVVVTQICLYLWIQRSVNGHFEQMDSEILTHAAFNLRQHMTDSLLDDQSITQLSDQPNQPVSKQSQPLQNAGLDYDVKTVITDEQGQIITSMPKGFISQSGNKRSVKDLWQQYHDQPFDLKVDSRHYRAIVIRHSERLALIALPIDVHHQYLVQFNRHLILILIAITFILVSVAALSVHLGFAPLSTIRQKMTRINAEQLDDRIVVREMPSELRPLADAYNAMMDKLEYNFESLSRFSDDIAHELRTPLATLSTQTQVMLSKPRDSNEYVEQLHHQHDTLEQLSGLINNMLLLAKTQKGVYDSQFTPVDSESLVTKMISYYELIAEDRGISFEKSGEFKAVLGDERLLQRLFANLISNAVYYAASNSIISIQASTVSDADVSDSNEITRSLLKNQFLQIVLTNRLDEPLTQLEVDKLSERFYRHHKNNTLHSGTGLGLSIAQAIINAHNGKMSIIVKNEYCFQVSIELLVSE
ncbi:histidine kinase dimerization/phospho-acceptor domain-containing protein [Psychrobacter sp. DAB_AL62B]|uniref:histidine kinase dimerization/phospho-acceptor domain-containing protein n=1 Tax=Psychrobacter sp. DAB_AL62B TaxID=1028420 RepID=UPI002380D03C|nr:histidine kinase dimerization/phospho-acceptor domain-containing protein [Psychrobacter sp. DAB_AL62B]MDE4453906.1 HAMP domain-containing protein [Psychrobacter sp. DAB_AL62B]